MGSIEGLRKLGLMRRRKAAQRHA